MASHVLSEKGRPPKNQGRLFAALRVTDFWDSPFASKEMGDTPPFFLCILENLIPAQRYLRLEEKMFKMRSIIILLSLAVILTGTGCNAILIGSGDVITETVPVSNFERISLEGQGEVRVTQDGNESLMVETYDNVMELVIAEVEGGTLKLGLEEADKLIFPRKLIFYVSVDDLTSLAVAGSGGVEAETIISDHLDAAVAGSGRIRISNLAAYGVKASIGGSGEIELAGGESGEQDVAISGSGKYDAGEVCSPSVAVSISGSGGATVCATESLEADISGSGSVGYHGQPTVNVSTTGSGSVNSLDQ
jgi:hypothetical protein